MKVLYWFLVVFALIQFVPVDRTHKPVARKDNFVDLLQTPQEVTDILKKACYDCHSNETKYPNYAYVAPISWSVKYHINKGRKHLNFSEWGTYNKELKQGMLSNSIEEIQENKMPLAGYSAQHPEARLTEKERNLLLDYFGGVLEANNF